MIGISKSETLDRPLSNTYGSVLKKHLYIAIGLTCMLSSSNFSLYFLKMQAIL